MSLINTKNLDFLAAPAYLKGICKALAVTEAIAMGNWEKRTFSYDSKISDNEELAAMQDSSGNEFVISFNPHGAVICGMKNSNFNNLKSDEKNFFSFFNKLKKVLTKEKASKLEEKMFEKVPAEFLQFLKEEPIASLGSTFVIWRLNNDQKWSSANLADSEDFEDGSSDILTLLNPNPMVFKNWLEEKYSDIYKDYQVPLQAILKIFAGGKLDRQVIQAINPRIVHFDELREELDDIGYPYEF